MIPKHYISIPALAKVLGISRIAVYKKVKKGQIKGVKLGRNFIVSKKDIHRTIDRSRYITIPQLAKELQVSRVCIHQRVMRGVIPAKKVGRNFLIPKEELHVCKKEQEFVSIPDLAKQLGISRIAVFKKVKKGLIKAEVRGKRYVIGKEEARKYMKGYRKKELEF